MARSGIAALTAEEGLALFDAALASGAPAVAAARLELGTLDGAEADALPAPLRALAPAPRRTAAAAGQPAAQAADLRGRLARAPRHERRHLVLEAVRGEVAAVLGHATPERVTADRRFQDLGFDSLTAVELRNRLTAVAGVRLPPTLIFDHPTPGALAERLRADLAPDTGADSTPETTPETTEEAGNGSEPTDGNSDLDTMNPDDLVRLALGDSES
ncbi:hypothetical protein G5C65_14405 [Streptomyces sp. SB3404]|uniref:Carrier domain-containing protein n=2 Tax=Streptomyces boncukensis TaxID=2711219 RepID=A0A6G4WW65_9ACTN|nr:hypothetical protein [Streptomyces boncukensis]